MSTDNLPSVDPRTLALRALILKILAGRVAEAIAANKEQLEAAMQVGDSKKPTLPGDRTRLGTVTYSGGALRVAVSDPKALADWCVTNYPAETELAVTVREAFVKKILDMSKAAERPCGPGGEVDIPGVTVKMGEPFISARPDSKVDDATWTHIIRGQDLDELTARDEVVDALIVVDDDDEAGQ